MSPRRAPGVYPVEATMGVRGAARYEVELPDGTVENVTAETLATPEYSAKVRQALQQGGVQGYSAVSRTPVLEREPPGTDLTGSSGTAIAIGEPQITGRVPRDIRVSGGAPGVSPRPFESLAAYAPQAENLPLGGPNSAGNAPQMMADSGGIPGTVQRLAMGGAAPDGLHPALAPLRDEGLKNAQRAARERSLLANLTRAGGMMIGRGKDSAYDSLDRAAGQPVEDYLQQQQLESQATAAQARQAEATRRAGLDEREMALKERPKPGMTAEELEMERQKVANDTTRARAAMISAQRSGGGGAGGDGLTPYQRARLDLDMAERNVPGFEFAQGGVPTRPSGEELRKTISRVGAIERSLNTMKDVFSRKGAEFGFGADLASSQAAQQEVLLNLKELENLGVLQKVDVDTLAGLYPRPNTMRGALDPAGMRAKFDEFQRVLRDTVAERAQARGYVPSAGGRWAGQGAAPAPTAATPPRPGMVRIRDPRTGRTGWATPDAVPAGAEVVR